VTPQSLDERAINAIRFLSVDAVQKANSGHPGLPMGAAAPAVLWTRFLRHNPSGPPGPTATASSCPRATDRCCCTRCCT
jgi:transketolase